MNSIWNKNVSLLKKRFPQLSQILLENLEAALPPHGQGKGSSRARCNEEMPPLEFPCGWRLVPARTGVMTGEPSLHSRYDPVREGQRLADSLAAEGSRCAGGASLSTVVFMGFGLGYGAVAVAERMGSQGKPGEYFDGLVLVEPDVDCFAAALWSVDFEPVFSLEHCALLVGAPHQSVVGVLENFGLEACHIIWNRSHTLHNQPYFDGLQTLVRRNLEKNQINSRTLEKFGGLWLRNSCRNLGYLVTCDGVSRYRDMGRDLDACIVGAGPSLDLILPYLAQIKERCLVIAVDTALRACLRFGVEPDFVVLSDPQYWNARHLAGLAASGTVLVTEVAAYPSVFRFACREIVLCSSLYPVGRYFSHCGLEKGDLGAGGSVATSCWELARLCGCGRIFLAAVDLGFPAKRTHARGSTFEERTHITSNRLSGCQSAHAAALFSAATALKKNYSGHPVLTDQRMELYAWWFESKVAACAEQETFSLTPESLAIPGVTLFSLEDLLSQPHRHLEREYFLERQGLAREAFLRQGMQLQKLFHDALANLQRGISQMYQEACHGEELCRKTLALSSEREFAVAATSVSTELAAIDGKLFSSPAKDAASLAFPSQGQLEKLHADAVFSENPLRCTLEKRQLFYQKLVLSLAEHIKFLH